MPRDEGHRHVLRMAVAGSSLALLAAAVFVAVTSDRGGKDLMPSRLELLGKQLQEEVALSSASDRKHDLEGLPGKMKNMIDFKEDICEDPYKFACGSWMKETKIPDYSSSWSASFDVAFVEVMKDMKEDLENDSGEAGLYYQSCMNEKVLDEAGTKPIKELFQRVGLEKINSRETFNDFLLELSIIDRAELFSWWVQQDEEDSDMHMLSVGSGSISMPDREYYLSEKFAPHRKAFVKTVTEVFSILDPSAGKVETNRKAEVVLAIETEMAKSMPDRGSSRGMRPDFSYTFANLTELCPIIEWQRVFDGLGMGDVGSPGAPRLAVMYPPSLKDLSKTISESSWEDVRTLIEWQLTKGYSPYLPKNMIDVFVEWNKDLYGLQVASPRDRKCFSTTQSALPQHLSRMFIERHTQPSTFNETESLLQHIRGEMAADFNGGVKWMSDRSRGLALKKLEAMGFRVGGPAKWRPRPHLNLSGTSFLMNQVQVETQTGVRERARLRVVPDKTRWTMASTTVNAYYDREQNSLFIPAAILLPPFFGGSKASNYGAIGTVLGHEMTHGFDDIGHLYDAKGRRSSVKQWDDVTEAGYSRQARCISDEFSSFTVAGGAHVNGNLTLGEDIADAGGLRLSYNAFKTASGGTLTLEQKHEFFMSFAQTWCNVERDAAQGAGVLSDEHAPAKWRVNGALRNFEPFSDAFGCPAGSRMSPPADERCVLW